MNYKHKRRRLPIKAGDDSGPQKPEGYESTKNINICSIACTRMTYFCNYMSLKRYFMLQII